MNISKCNFSMAEAPNGKHARDPVSTNGDHTVQRSDTDEEEAELDVFRALGAPADGIDRLAAAVASGPDALLQPSEEIASFARAAAKELIDYAAKQSAASAPEGIAGNGGADSGAAAPAALYVEGFDAEQIWLQLDMLSAPALKKARKLMRKAEGIEKLIPEDVEEALDGELTVNWNNWGLNCNAPFRCYSLSNAKSRFMIRMFSIPEYYADLLAGEDGEVPSDADGDLGSMDEDGDGGSDGADSLDYDAMLAGGDAAEDDSDDESSLEGGDDDLEEDDEGLDARVGGGQQGLGRRRLTNAQARAAVEDDFMKLDEMEAFLQAAERAEAGEEDEEELDEMDVSDSDVDDDALDPEGGGVSEEDDEEEAALEALLDNAVKAAGQKKRAKKRKRAGCESPGPVLLLHHLRLHIASKEGNVQCV